MKPIPNLKRLLKPIHPLPLPLALTDPEATETPCTSPARDTFRPARRLPIKLADGRTASRFSVKVELGAAASITGFPESMTSATFDVISTSPQEAADFIEDRFNLRSEPCTTVEVMGPKGGLPVKRFWGWESTIGHQLGLCRQPTASTLPLPGLGN